MTEAQYKMCVCGHVLAHHVVTGYMLNDCKWQGCGCPTFLQEKTSPPVEEEYAPH